VKVLITGSLGQLGMELQRSAPKNIELTAIDYEQLDITDRDSVIQFVVENKPSVIINAAAYTAVDKAETESDLAFAVNAAGPENLAVAAKRISARLIHVSTDYVFDGTSSTPYTPDAMTSPLGEYGSGKLEGEKRVADVLGESYVVVRTAWLYSPHGNNFVKTMLRLMSSRDSISVVADQVGTPTSAKTLADAIWKFIDNTALSGVYHFTDNGVASWYDFAVAIMEEALVTGMLDKEVDVCPISTVDYPTPTQRPACSVLDKSKTLNDLAINGVHWRKVLREMLASLTLKT